MNKRFVGILIAGFCAISTAFGQITGMQDILLWTGSGANESALVFDFHGPSGRQSFAFGYRWDGTATAQDMITAVDQAWVELSVSSPFYVVNVSFFDVVTGITHDETGGSFATYPTDYLNWGYYVAGGTATAFSPTPPFSPVGTVTIPGGGSSVPVSWTTSPSGSADRFLANGSWDAFSFGQSNQLFVHQTPPSGTVYAAVPEPSQVALLLFAGAIVFFHARKRLHCS